MRRLVNEQHFAARRRRVERARRKRGLPHIVEYFHQVDDGYSHLAAQLLGSLLARYDIELRCHLAPAASGGNAPEPELLRELSRFDSVMIASHYGLRFPSAEALPRAALVELASRILAATNDATFAELAPRVGDALWSGDEAKLETLAESQPPVDAATAERRVALGGARREKLGHYSGGMFYYGKEWYWGVDRLYHLERRLIALGAAKTPSENLLAPPPAWDFSSVSAPLPDDDQESPLTLEVYPSVRSPYTSIAFGAAVDLARATGVRLRVRPVLPMVMRGLSVPRQKGLYIFTDAAREARAHGLRWGNLRDPVGEPTRRCYSLYPWAASQGRGVALLAEFMRAAFFDGVDTGTTGGLRRVVEAAGLSWREAEGMVGNTDWQEEIEANRQAMYRLGLWGVPSFHLFTADGETLLRAWGQDRLWLVAREIRRYLDAAMASRTGR